MAARVGARARTPDADANAASGSSRRRCGHFAEHGYRGGRVEDIAAEVGVAKGTVFLDFGSKEGLFLAAYQRAVSMLPAWLDAPEECVAAGLLGDARLVAGSHRGVRRTRTRCPTASPMIGRYDTGLQLRRPIDRFMRSEDPYGTLEFVEFGVRRGEIRDDVDAEMIGLDAGLGRRAVPGRAGLRGARPGSDPPQAGAARAAGAARSRSSLEVLRAGMRTRVTRPRHSVRAARRSCASPTTPGSGSWPRGTAPGRAVASRFVAGETLAEAMAAARDLDRQRITAMLDHLGENVTTPEQALAGPAGLPGGAGRDRRGATPWTARSP